MTNRVLLGIAAALVSIAIASIGVVAAGWFSEAAMPFTLTYMSHSRHIATFVAIFGSFPGVAIALVVAGRQKRAEPEEPMRPRIRAGRL